MKQVVISAVVSDKAAAKIQAAVRATNSSHNDFYYTVKLYLCGQRRWQRGAAAFKDEGGVTKRYESQLRMRVRSFTYGKKTGLIEPKAPKPSWRRDETDFKVYEIGAQILPAPQGRLTPIPEMMVKPLRVIRRVRKYHRHEHPEIVVPAPEVEQPAPADTRDVTAKR